MTYTQFKELKAGDFVYIKNSKNSVYEIGEKDYFIHITNTKEVKGVIICNWFYHYKDIKVISKAAYYDFKIKQLELKIQDNKKLLKIFKQNLADAIKEAQ